MWALEATLTIACSAGVFFGRANVLLAKAHDETRKEVVVTTVRT